jgi:hypothetical protein
MIRYVAMTSEEGVAMIDLQDDPEKKYQLALAVYYPQRASGDKIYIASNLVDGLRLPWFTMNPTGGPNVTNV